MLELIQKTLFTHYKKDDIKWLFVSSFDNNGNMLVSNGAIHTDKPLHELITTLYHGILEQFQQSKIIVCDVIETIELAKDIEKLKILSMKEYGIFVSSTEDNKSGVILPDTMGVADFNNALYLIQQKNHISGNATIYTFTTKRIVIENK